MTPAGRRDGFPRASAPEDNEDGLRVRDRP